MSTNHDLNRKLRMGLVGGGQGSFIGRVHCTAAVLDNRASLVAGALSSNPQRAKDSAADYDISDDRAYGSYQEMLEGESGLPADQKIDFVSIATPNHTHFEIAKAAVDAGFNVICDKPMTFDLAQAEGLLMLLHAQDQQQALGAVQWLNGGLTESVQSIRQQLQDLLALLEVGLDFDDADTGAVAPELWLDPLAPLAERMQALLSSLSSL